jgi:hypothetical protein
MSVFVSIVAVSIVPMPTRFDFTAWITSASSSGASVIQYRQTSEKDSGRDRSEFYYKCQLGILTHGQPTVLVR